MVELCAIMKECSQSGVASLKLGDFEVVFAPKGVTSPVVAPPSDTEMLGESARSLKNEEFEHKHDRLAMMLIEDPVEAERLIMSGETTLEEEVDGEEAQFS